MLILMHTGHDRADETACPTMSRVIGREARTAWQKHAAGHAFEDVARFPLKVLGLLDLQLALQVAHRLLLHAGLARLPARVGSTVVDMCESARIHCVCRGFQANPVTSS